MVPRDRSLDAIELVSYAAGHGGGGGPNATTFDCFRVLTLHEHRVALCEWNQIGPDWNEMRTLGSLESGSYLADEDRDVRFALTLPRFAIPPTLRAHHRAAVLYRNGGCDQFDISTMKVVDDLNETVASVLNRNMCSIGYVGLAPCAADYLFALGDNRGGILVRDSRVWHSAIKLSAPPPVRGSSRTAAPVSTRPAARPPAAAGLLGRMRRVEARQRAVHGLLEMESNGSAVVGVVGLGGGGPLRSAPTLLSVTADGCLAIYDVRMVHKLRPPAPFYRAPQGISDIAVAYNSWGEATHVSIVSVNNRTLTLAVADLLRSEPLIVEPSSRSSSSSSSSRLSRWDGQWLEDQVASFQRYQISMGLHCAMAAEDHNEPLLLTGIDHQSARVMCKSMEEEEEEEMLSGMGSDPYGRGQTSLQGMNGGGATRKSGGSRKWELTTTPTMMSRANVGAVMVAEPGGSWAILA